MRFNDSSPIYEQIADNLAAQAASGFLPPGSRLPSARDLAVSLEVNPNTAARALQVLADRGIARCERGTGYFLAEDGPAVAARERRGRFFSEELPRFFARMEELGIDMETIHEEWRSRTAGTGGSKAADGGDAAEKRTV
ncbi:MAG: GntR family transcriptional regulator [Treponema sp.]|nr:GntR family transcriptional regulator [Treponema sp.]